MSIKQGDKIRLVKAMGIFDNIGEVCEVTEVTEEGLIYFKFGYHHLGCMSGDELDTYFELVVEEPEMEDVDDADNSDMVENKEVYELIEWCKANDKPFYPNLYLSVTAKRQDANKSILGMYANRLCLVQFRDKTFKDSDFSTLKILI